MTGRERWENLAAALVLPFLLHIELSLITLVFLPSTSWASEPLLLTTSLAAGLVFLVRAASYLSVLLAIFYVPALIYLLPVAARLVERAIFPY